MLTLYLAYATADGAPITIPARIAPDFGTLEACEKTGQSFMRLGGSRVQFTCDERWAS